MKLFQLLRLEDESGVSGTGVVANGVIFRDGTAVMMWDSESGVNSLGIYKSIGDLENIHGHGGKTKVIYW